MKSEPRRSNLVCQEKYPVLVFFIILVSSFNLCMSIQMTTYLVTGVQYRSYKLIGGNIISQRSFVSGGKQGALNCVRLCAQNLQCAAINYCLLSSGTGLCELLEGNLCSNATGVWNLQSATGCTAWENRNDGLTCMSTSTQACAKILPLCGSSADGPLCDTCTRTCHEFFVRYHNKPTYLAGIYFSVQVWPSGISAQQVNVDCYSDKFMYLYKRQVDISTGQLIQTFNFNISSFQVASTIVERAIYPRIQIFFNGQGYTCYGAYSIQSFEKDGTLRVTYLPFYSNYDVLGLNGKPLVKAPFLNNTNTNPVCGPFWLLPTGNTSCPGGDQVRFWGRVQRIATRVVTGFLSPHFNNYTITIGRITLEK